MLHWDRAGVRIHAPGDRLVERLPEGDGEGGVGDHCQPHGADDEHGPDQQAQRIPLGGGPGGGEWRQRCDRSGQREDKATKSPISTTRASSAGSSRSP